MKKLFRRKNYIRVLLAIFLQTTAIKTATPCTPYDEMVPIFTLDGADNDGDEFSVNITVGPLHPIKNISGIAQYQENQILKDRFAKQLGKSNLTGYDWRLITPTLFYKVFRDSWEMSCLKDNACTIYQVVGVCGNYRIGTPATRKIQTLSSYNFQDKFKQLQKTCENRYFQCKNGECIDQEYLCDDDEDCWDASDEEWDMCTHLKDPFPVKTESCKFHELKCENGSCYEPLGLCDGIVDCLYGNDESYWNCVSSAAEIKDLLLPSSCIPYETMESIFAHDNVKDKLDVVRVDGTVGPRVYKIENNLPPFEYDHNLMKERFAHQFGKSNMTGYDWRLASSTLFTKVLSRRWAMHCPPYSICTLYQVVGKCGKLGVRTPGGRSRHERKIATNGGMQSNNSCSKESFQCHNGECVDDKYTCDDEENCSDGSDEEWHMCTKLNDPFPMSNATCKIHEFKCGDGMCLFPFSVCGGRVNCMDGSDESRLNCEISKVTPAKTEGYTWLQGFWEHVSNFLPAYLFHARTDANHRSRRYICRSEGILGDFEYDDRFKQYLCTGYSLNELNRTIQTNFRVDEYYEVFVQPSLVGSPPVQWELSGRGNIYDGTIIGGMTKKEYSLYFLCQMFVYVPQYDTTKSIPVYGKLYPDPNRSGCQASWKERWISRNYTLLRDSSFF